MPTTHVDDIQYCDKKVKQLADETVIFNQSETAANIPKIILDKGWKS